MKTGKIFCVWVMITLCGCSSPQKETANENQAMPEEEGRQVSEAENMEQSKYAKLLYMGQASIRIVTAEGKVIYIDPYCSDQYDMAADLILVTHAHYDHNGTDKVTCRNSDCRLITWKEALTGGTHRTFDLGYARVEAVEAGYNRWHDVKQCVGYVVTLSGGVSVYVSGDTSKTEQMADLSEKQIDYAFYCCDGVFNMGLEEAAECAELVGAKHNIPYHVLAEEGVYFDRKRAEQFEVQNRLILSEGEEIELIPSSSDSAK